ncbi:MAG: SpoIIE family protein phosphatase [Solirubrobacterales bacterium]|nr:SpoIIE family protein phosphatase [Solirubrobacterales bacterium]
MSADRLLDDLFAHAPVGLALLDERFRYVRVNDAIAEMNGGPAADHAGRDVADVVGPEAAAAVRPLFERALGGEVLSDLEAEALGRRFRISYLPTTLAEGGRGVLAVVVETTAEREAELALRVTEQRLRLALEGTRTGTWEWDVAADAIRWSPMVFALHGMDESAGPPPDLRTYERQIHPDDVAAFRDGLAAAAAGGEFEHEFRIVWPDGTVRWIWTRAHAQHDDAGALRRLVGLTTDVTERRVRELASELLSRAGLLLSAPLGPDEVLRELADLVVPELADWCSIVVPDADGGLRSVAVAHADPERVRWAREVEQRYPPDPAAPAGAGAVIRSGRPELFEELPEAMVEAAARDEEHLRLIRELQIRSAMVVPLIARGRTLGAITFVGAESGRRYAARDLELAEELGRRAGLALDNARLLEAEREARRAAERLSRRLAALRNVAELALTHADLDDLLRALLAEVVTATGADHAVVMLPDEDAEHLVIRAAIGFADVDVQTPVPVGEGFTGRIAAAAAPVVVPDLRDPAVEVLQRHLKEEARSLAGVPLIAGDEVGVLHVSTAEPRAFDDDDLELLALVADRAGLAIEHTRLYARATTTARTLQRSLLPAQLPTLPGLEFAAHYAPGQDGTEVGGDWYDVFPLAEGAAAVAVGDVVGRGLRAAATMGRLRTALRVCALDERGACAPLERLHRFAAGDPDADFATVVLLAIDAHRRRARVCSAGHLPPIVVAPDGSAAPAPVDPGPPLGAPGPGERRETEIALEPGTVVLLYTDGLVERRSERLDDRIDQLARAAAHPPAELGDYVVGIVQALGVEEARRDDVALVAVRVTA